MPSDTTNVRSNEDQVSVVRRPRTLIAAMAVALSAAALAVPVALAAPVAQAAAASKVATSHSIGLKNHIGIDRYGVLRVVGWSFDPAAPTAHVAVYINADGRTEARTTTHLSRPDVAKVLKRYKAGPTTGFATTTKTTLAPGAHRICVHAWNAAHTAERALVCVIRHRPDPNTLLAAYAKTFVGRYRYRSGGSSPSTGFDCSGLTAYVYKHSINRTLTHQSQSQWHQMRHVSRASARPGDVVFFFSGSVSFHVGIYEGGNMMVAAATPSEGIKYQAIWMSNVRFGTITH